MNGRRNATRDIWRAVVFAGAMLGTGACGGSTAQAPQPAQPVADPCAGAVDPCGPEDPCAAVADPCAGDEDPCAAVDPCADPCGAWDEGDPCARPRGDGDDGPQGRGFVLA